MEFERRADRPDPHLVDRLRRPFLSAVAPDPATIRSAVDLDLREFLVQRLRAAGTILALSCLLWMIGEFSSTASTSVAVLSVQILLVLSGAIVVGGGDRAWLHRHALSLAILFSGVICVGIAVLSIVRGNADSILLMFAVYSVASAALLPWGPLAQLVTVAFCLLGLVLTFTAVGVPLREGFIFGDAMGLLVALFYSVFVAYQLRLFRSETLEEAIRLRFAQQVVQESENRVRALNAELEQRVFERTADLNEAIEEMTALTSAVSHDLRPPLRTVNGLLAMLEEDSSGRLDAEERAYIDRSRAAVVNMGLLIDDLLALSRVRGARFARRRIDLGRIARRITDHLQEKEPSRRVDFRIGDDLHAFADEDLAATLLENLLENAWKFSRRELKAEIEFGVTEDATDGRVFFVRDNGVGFDMAHAGKLFGTFERLRTLDEFEGTGIGLATVVRIVRRHGGKAWAESEPGSGATFFFTLPEHC